MTSEEPAETTEEWEGEIENIKVFGRVLDPDERFEKYVSERHSKDVKDSDE